MKWSASHGVRRLIAQQIARHSFSAPSDIVSSLGAVQAQDYEAAKWAVGLRLPLRSAKLERIERALAEGAVLRTHALRGTWHFVAPADIRWILALVGPRIIARNSRRYRALALDAATFRRSRTALEKALRNGGHLTRDELAAALGRAGVSAAGPRLSHLLARAELDALICSGAPRGTRATYALLDDRAPSPRAPLARNEALARLARRYFQSRGPATAGDFTWWSGLTASDARAGLDAVRSTLASDTKDGRTYWRSDEPLARASVHTAYLLPAFDEYLVAYRDRDTVLDRAHAKRLNAGGGMLDPCVVSGGRVIGTWRRAVERTTVTIEVDLFEEPTSRVHRAIAAAGEHYGAYLGLDARLLRTTTL
jgi:hypothetical protein